ncbi:hypothetical protein B0H10DRAFT_2095824 [Mycena sp. CBHHK59/15]|nr:hypothetical protein B0H10DRAFT_2095824 [Mycena sp. CBHHK59/15]
MRGLFSLVSGYFVCILRWALHAYPKIWRRNPQIVITAACYRQFCIQSYYRLRDDLAIRDFIACHPCCTKFHLLEVGAIIVTAA